MSQEPFHEGQKSLIQGPDGAQRPALFVGTADGMSFLGGPPIAYVVFTDTREAAEVQLDWVVARD